MPEYLGKAASEALDLYSSEAESWVLVWAWGWEWAWDWAKDPHWGWRWRWFWGWARDWARDPHWVRLPEERADA